MVGFLFIFIGLALVVLIIIRNKIQTSRVHKQYFDVNSRLGYQYGPPPSCKIGYLYDLVGQYEYMVSMMSDMFERYKAKHPIGSLMEVQRSSGIENDTYRYVLQSELDQFHAFIGSDVGYRRDPIKGVNVPDTVLHKCLVASRFDAVKRGYAPDNVEYCVFDGWDAEMFRPYGDSTFYTSNIKSVIPLYREEFFQNSYTRNLDTLPNCDDIVSEDNKSYFADKEMAKRLERIKSEQKRRNEIAQADHCLISYVQQHNAEIDQNCTNDNQKNRKAWR